MNLKFTFNLKSLNTLKLTVFALFLTSIASIFGQTVTEVFPSRITTNSKITVLGTDFTESTSISINGININSGSITLLSDTEMLFAISHSGSSDVTGELVVGGVSTGINIDYISPTHKTLKNGETSNVTKITEIFTTYNGFWRSSLWKADPTNNNLKPNTSHDLLAFTYNGVTYSTGVDDQLLTDNGITFSSQLFYAYTTNGVDGTTYGSNYLAMADLIDGEVGEGTSITSEDILGTKIYDVLIDGVNGLDIGTGVTNFNATTDVEFYSAGGQLGALDDDIPDFLISQIAMAGSTDIYYYTDSEKNVVGRPVKLTILDETDLQGDALLAQWRLDLYNFTPGVNYGVATPQSRAFSNNEQRPLRMVALKFEDFHITDSNIANINNVNMVAGGTADLGFVAYNRGSFDIKTPVFTEYPAARFVCQLPSDANISFTATATVSGGATGAPEETLSYQWFKYNDPIAGATSNTYTLPSTLNEESLGIYKLRVSNSYGSVVVPVSLSLGGTPMYWNGSEWELPPVYQNAGVVVEPQDRGLVFSSNYNETGDIEGCDCLVPTGSNVTIPSGSTLKLYGEVTVESGASLTFQDSASLIQTKAVENNENSGSIKVKREVTDLHENDYVLWSSPVANFDVSNISTAFPTDAFTWNVNTANTDGLSGDWVLATGTMDSGLGYAVNVPTDLVTTGFTTTLIGTPNNGDISVDVYKSTGNLPNLEARHRNLIGNPYPSAISAEQLLIDNTILEGHIKIWAHNSAIPNTTTPLTSAAYQDLNYNYGEQYVSYNFTGANPPASTNGYIGSGQGFFVQLDDSASEGAVTFTNAMRSNDANVAHDNTEFYRGVNNAQDIEKHVLWLSLIDDTNTSASTLVGYVEGATLAKDRLFDAYSDEHTMRIYSLVDNVEMVIQGRPLPFVDTDVVPLGVELPENGIFKIAIGDIDGSVFMDTSVGIYLEDTVLNIEHDLRESPYSFSGVQGKINDRFNLRYITTLSIDDNVRSNTFAYVKDNMLNVRSESGIRDIKVFDINGRGVMHYTFNGEAHTISQGFQFSKGVYLANITLEGNITVSTKLIN